MNDQFVKFLELNYNLTGKITRLFATRLILSRERIETRFYYSGKGNLSSNQFRNLEAFSSKRRVAKICLKLS